MSSKEIKKDLMIYLPAKIIEAILGMVAISVYTRLLGAEGYGQVQGVTVGITVCYTFFSVWVYHAAYRFLSEQKTAQEEERYLTTLFGLIFATQLVAAIGLYFSKLVMHSSIHMGFYMLLYLAYSVMFVLTAIIIAKRKVVLTAIVSVLSTLAKLLLMILLYHTIMPDFQSVLWSQMFIDFITVIVYYLNVGMKINLKSFDTALAKKFLKYAYPLVGLSLAISVLNLSDRYIIPYLTDLKSLGYYTGNYSIPSAAFTMIMFAIMRSIYPNILAAYNNGRKEEANHLLDYGTRLYLLIALPSAMGLSILSKPISKLILGAGFDQYSNIIIWVSWGMLFYGLSEYLIKPLELTRKTNSAFLMGSIAGVVNIGLNFMFIPILGFEFAAISTCFAYFIYCCIAFYTGRSLIKITYDFKSISGIVLSTLIMGVSGYYLKQIGDNVSVLFLTIIFCVIIYFIIIYMTGAFKEDFNVLAKKIGGKLNDRLQKRS